VGKERGKKDSKKPKVEEDIGFTIWKGRKETEKGEKEQ